MATLFTPTADKSYKTIDNAVKAVEKAGFRSEWKYMVVKGDDDRYRPVFFSAPKGESPMPAVWAGFTVVGSY